MVYLFGMTTPAEFLQRLKADELNACIEADIDAFDDNDSTSVIGLLVERYPQLAEFIQDCFVGNTVFDELSEEDQISIMLPAYVALGAICRTAELRSLPSVTD